MYDVKLIASYFIKKANELFIDENITEGISHLKLQKILYFAQVVFLVVRGKPCFDDEIYAWKYGPVIKSIYDEYSKNRQKRNLSLTLEDILFDNFDDISKEDISLLDDIWDEFGKYSASELVEITHSHKPWKDANDSDVIEKHTLQEYYKDIILLD